jgi:hypothetical protein
MDYEDAIEVRDGYRLKVFAGTGKHAGGVLIAPHRTDFSAISIVMMKSPSQPHLIKMTLKLGW